MTEQKIIGADKTGMTNSTISVHHLIVLDESGSMQRVRQSTISGCNETLGTIRTMQEENKNAQHHLVSIFLFDSNAEHSRYIRQEVPIDEIDDITSDDYKPHGSTPLYDALGLTLGELSPLIKTDESIGYVTIITDGHENSSHEFGLDDVKRLIDALKEKGVVFSFIGANIDAKEYGERLHINNTLQFTQDDNGTREMWAMESRSKVRSSRRLSMKQRMEAGLVDFSKEENDGKYYDFDHLVPDHLAPDTIDNLTSNQVFVFGTSADGKHEEGTAKTALDKYGAVMGQGEGMQGQSYAIPVKEVSEAQVYRAVKRFISFAKDHSDREFIVTEVGCDTATWRIDQVAPFFYDAMPVKNIRLPRRFWEYNIGI